MPVMQNLGNDLSTKKEQEVQSISQQVFQKESQLLKQV